MNHFRFPRLLTLVSLSALAFGAVGCSNQSPTEPAGFDAPAAKSLSVEKRHGADDPAGDDRGGRQGRGADDPAGDDHGGRRGRGRGNQGGQNGQQQRPARGAELEGTVASVSGGSLVLAGGQRIVVNGQTQWNRRGDLTTLDQVAAALAAGNPTRAEARGTRQPDGSLLAQTLKVEVD
jgi:hypothetical protein